MYVDPRMIKFLIQPQTKFYVRQVWFSWMPIYVVEWQLCLVVGCSLFPKKSRRAINELRAITRRPWTSGKSRCYKQISFINSATKQISKIVIYTVLCIYRPILAKLKCESLIYTYAETSIHWSSRCLDTPILAFWCLPICGRPRIFHV